MRTPRSLREETSMNEPVKFTPMGDRRPEDVMKNPTRRLCQFTYQCSLCGNEHQAEHFISMEVNSLEEYIVKLKELVTNSERMVLILGGASQELHEERGDLDKLTRKIRRNGPYQMTKPPSVILTNEDRYICDNCQRVFRSNQELRKHGRSCA